MVLLFTCCLVASRHDVPLPSNALEQSVTRLNVLEAHLGVAVGGTVAIGVVTAVETENDPVKLKPWR